jgi:crotonobetainyl-CoA:carnitine CoA-transferase CaiB-like acyl-CoA transferase
MIVMENNGGVLSDIKVLDLSQGVAGPFCAKFLAGLGAEVIKVEPPFTGDSSRQSEPIMGGESGLERSALFAYLNTSKKSITDESASSNSSINRGGSFHVDGRC